MIKQIRRLLKLADKYKARIRAAYLFSFFKSMCSYAPYMMSVYIIRLLYDGNITIEDVFIIALLMVLFLAGQAGCSYISDRLQSTAGYLLFAD